MFSFSTVYDQPLEIPQKTRTPPIGLHNLFTGKYPNPSEEAGSRHLEFCSANSSNPFQKRPSVERTSYRFAIPPGIMPCWEGGPHAAFKLHFWSSARVSC
jgi:hypothetical protein